MATRMRTGRTVQATSRMVLCVVREGTGFLSSLKRKITAMRRPATKMQMIAMSQTSQV